MDKAFAALSDEERVAHYRQRAADSMDHAHQSSTDEDRAGWLIVASKWAALADEVEKQAQREADIAAMNVA